MKVKNKSVCKGCKYLMSQNAGSLNGACDYITKTGHSRLVVEMANGGYKSDSCPCRETGRTRRRKELKLPKTREADEQLLDISDS